MKPSFTIITTTFNRPESVLKSVNSVLLQTYTNWRLIVVIDDPISDYSSLSNLSSTNPKITLLQNKENVGKNASVNRALTILREENFAGYIIFLDDDDWLSPSCLQDFTDSIDKNQENNWLVSQRVNIFNQVPFTKNTTGRTIINYFKDCLVSHRFSGDTTHCLNFASVKNISFPTRIKNAEEWLYFSEVATLEPNFTYLPKAGTYSEGYAEAGLTDIYHEQKQKRHNLLPIIKEVWQRKLFSPYVIFYVLIRTLRSVI
jgi:glycosyltransferase involved in cell wall biosynthesis